MSKRVEDSPCRQWRWLPTAAERQARAVANKDTETVKVEDQEENARSLAEMSVT